MEFRILGPLEVVDRGQALTVTGTKQRALLASLLLRPNEPVPADRLVDALWGDEPPDGAVNALQYHVSQLRKFLGGERIVTRAPGYLVRLEPDELDLLRFARLVEAAGNTAPERAAAVLRDALALWRGPPLADLAGEAFADAEIRRLEELRLAALEQRVEADVALGRAAQLVPELEALVHEHPFRERLAAALMRALYAAGRQAEALDVYRRTRRNLVDELGIEPGPALQELEKAVLRHDPALAPDAELAAPRRAILVLAGDDHRLDDLLAIAEPLASNPSRELILARLLLDSDGLAAGNAALAARRAALIERGVACRVAAYTTPDAGAEAALLAAEQDVDLVLAEAPADLLESGRPDATLRAVLDGAPCDVGLLAGRAGDGEGPVVTPFAGVEHDWSAIELAAWLAASLGTTLRLLGTEADPALGRRDASRLLARASMMVQQMVGIVTEPVLIPAGERGVVEASAGARLLVLGLSDRWQSEGLGRARLAVAAEAAAPILFVRRGLRPSGLAPPGTVTRFTWTLAS
jgi:DNA-binding SARP family transcriptional activator